MIFFFVLFAFAWRLVSVLYIDLFGPFFSDQLARDIGPGISALPIAVSQAIVIIAMLLSFRQQRVLRLFGRTSWGWPAACLRTIFALRSCVLAVALFVVALWAGAVGEVARSRCSLGIERFDYTRLYGGPLHRRLLEWGPMLAFQLGVFFAVPLLHDRPSDWRLAPFGALILYLFLAGHQFSSFYAYTSFFIMPIGVVLIGGQEAVLPSRGDSSGICYVTCRSARFADRSDRNRRRLFRRRRAAPREGSFSRRNLAQRILVQQGEMWWMTYERVFLQDDWNGGDAAYKLFVDPFVPIAPRLSSS